MDYWIVKDNRNGKIISHCGSINDAIMMVGFDPDYRSFYKNKLIGDQVITVNATSDKQLNGKVSDEEISQPKLDYFKNKLPEGEGIPINISL